MSRRVREEMKNGEQHLLRVKKIFSRLLLPFVVVMLFLAITAKPKKIGAQQVDPKAGKKIYDTVCARCHGKTGKGDGLAAVDLPVKPQDHTDGKHMNVLTDQYLADIIKGGGDKVGKSILMPSWGEQLKDNDVRNLIGYIRSLAVPPYHAVK